jgi:hypothetical protein
MSRPSRRCQEPQGVELEALLGERWDVHLDRLLAAQRRVLEAGLEAGVVDQHQAAGLQEGLVEAGRDLSAVPLEVGQDLRWVRLGAVQKGQLWGTVLLVFSPLVGLRDLPQVGGLPGEGALQDLDLLGVPALRLRWISGLQLHRYAGVVEHDLGMPHAVETLAGVVLAGPGQHHAAAVRLVVARGVRRWAGDTPRPPGLGGWDGPGDQQTARLQPP